MGKPKELYVKPRDVNRQPTEFDLIRTPCGLDVRQRMLADNKKPTESMGASEYDGSTAIEADSN